MVNNGVFLVEVVEAILIDVENLALYIEYIEGEKILKNGMDMKL